MIAGETLRVWAYTSYSISEYFSIPLSFYQCRVQQRLKKPGPELTLISFCWSNGSNNHYQHPEKPPNLPHPAAQLSQRALSKAKTCDAVMPLTAVRLWRSVEVTSCALLIHHQTDGNSRREDNSSRLHSRSQTSCITRTRWGEKDMKMMGTNQALFAQNQNPKPNQRGAT